MIINCDSTRFIYEVMEGEEYSYLFDHLTVLDAGCNIGAFSLWIYPRADVIVAVDLVDQNIKHLKKTVEDNKYYKIHPVCCAIAGKTGPREAREFDLPGDGSGKMIESGNIVVDAYTTLDFMKKNKIHHVDVMKLDVEGAEYEIFEDPTFPVDRINTIVGEYHLVSPGTQLSNLGYTYQEWGSHFLARR
jgi:FkbM family methyltransferase